MSIIAGEEMIKYRPKWCPSCKYYLPQRGASSHKCLNKGEVMWGESKIKCYAYTEIATGETLIKQINERTQLNEIQDVKRAVHKDWIAWFNSTCNNRKHRCFEYAFKWGCKDCREKRMKEIGL